MGSARYQVARSSVESERPVASWCVYIVRCRDGSLYTGIAKDLARRVAEHNSGRLPAARYTRTRRPVELVYQEPCNTRSEASRKEHQIKQLNKQQKEMLIRRTRKGSSDSSRRAGHGHCDTRFRSQKTSAMANAFGPQTKTTRRL